MQVVFRRKASKELTIEFIPLTAESGRIFDPPVPTAKVIPEWYKRQKAQVYDDIAIDPVSGNSARTIKACMPVFDMLSSGYSILLPADIYVKDSPNGPSPEMSWSIDHMQPIDYVNDPLQFRRIQGSKMIIIRLA